jgi:hypothetical protein
MPGRMSSMSAKELAELEVGHFQAQPAAPASTAQLHRVNGGYRGRTS